jgi:uncharacterized DUF497 family protein
MPPQQVVWDPVKARRNKKKHGVDFEEAATVFRDQLLLILPDPAHSGEENRWVALEKSVSQLLLVVVHTEDERRVRIISARKAEPRERGNMRSTRKAALTASASGKAKATSGARVTITTSCGKRFRYFPRSARPKSYSGCTSLFFLGRLEFLLIAFPLELKIHE